MTFHSCHGSFFNDLPIVFDHDLAFPAFRASADHFRVRLVQGADLTVPFGDPGQALGGFVWSFLDGFSPILDS